MRAACRSSQEADVSRSGRLGPRRRAIEVACRLLPLHEPVRRRALVWNLDPPTRSQPVDHNQPRAWDDTNAMVTALEARHAAQMPLWSVYSYDNEAQYNRKLRWYAGELREIDHTGSILDIGCGSGEILHWYQAPPRYLGLDVTPVLVEQARVAHPLRRFECVDVLSASLDRFDTVVMIGLLGLSPRPLELIERACDLTRVHLLFDFLVDRPGHRNSKLRLCYLSRDDVTYTLARNGLDVVRTHQVGANLAIVARRSDCGQTQDPPLL